MRYLIICLSLLLWSCATTNLPPADPSKEMMERADRVIITVEEDSEDAFKSVGQYLSDKGFALHNTNKDLMNIQTRYKSFGLPPFGNYNLRINASIRDSTIHFYAQTGNEVLGEYEIDNRSEKEWEKLLEIATDYPHNEVYYSRN